MKSPREARALTRKEITDLGIEFLDLSDNKNKTKSKKNEIVSDHIKKELEKKQLPQDEIDMILSDLPSYYFWET